MISHLKSSFIMLVLIVGVVLKVAAGEKPGTFSPYVDGKGNIVLPSEFRSTWVHLGTWVLTSTLAAGPDLRPTGPQAGVQNVYAKAEAVKGYRQNGKWPDGAAIVMEVRAIKWDDLSTGHVIGEGDPLQWFVMIKDAAGRFPGNVNWGNGWGWALFKAADGGKNASTAYKQDCLSCHDPARSTDFIFIQGYPVLNQQGR